MKYKNYIWDFDGTLYNTYVHEIKVMWEVLGRHGLTETINKEEMYRWMRVGYGNITRFPGVTEEIYNEFRHEGLKIGDEEHEPRILPFEDCGKVLSAIVKNGGRNYIYTHRDKTTLTWYLTEYGMIGYFTDAVTSDEHFPMKPSPEGLLALCERNGLVLSESIMIGDRIIDGACGRNAGMSGALVNYPPHLPDGRSPAEDVDLDYTATSLTEFACKVGVRLGE
ncbi:MAG: hypothetical protein E7627_06155 [Ruminococcaceae bacterium]|nr:hypothetical protein [Oscillospiraceae bacterium]